MRLRLYQEKDKPGTLRQLPPTIICNMVCVALGNTTEQESEVSITPYFKLILWTS